MKKLINIIIFLFIFVLYFITFLMIYDNFRERKIKDTEKETLELLENKIEKNISNNDNNVSPNRIYSFNYNGYTILGKLEIPQIGLNTVVLKEHTYSAMNIGAIKTYGVGLNQEGGFVISAHNYRANGAYFYPIRLLKNGAKVYITDASGNKLEYTVYSVSRYVNPSDVSYLTKYDGYHVTLVTCEYGGKSRIVVKARVEKY